MDNLASLKELAKGALFILIGLCMFPLIVFLEITWNRWATLWNGKVHQKALFLMLAPLYGVLWTIVHFWAVPWQKISTG